MRSSPGAIRRPCYCPTQCGNAITLNTLAAQHGLARHIVVVSHTILALVLPPTDSTMFPLRPARDHSNQFHNSVVYMLNHAAGPDVTHNA